MKYAVIKVQGKQYAVHEGQLLTVNQMDAEEGSTVKIADVLLVVDDKDVQVGTPVVDKAVVSVKVVKHFKGEKIRVATFKAKSRQRKVRGHRQLESTLEIMTIAAK